VVLAVIVTVALDRVGVLISDVHAVADVTRFVAIVVVVLPVSVYGPQVTLPEGLDRKICIPAAAALTIFTVQVAVVELELTVAVQVA
jgi:hypothetical protein